ncbi:MAG: DUF167 domain-containing protein [Candidatus Paceibacterota bacterium]|jgi:hypothetical protein
MKMLIKVKVFPCAREEEIIEKSKDSFEVRIKEKPVMGQANKGVIRVLAGHFGVPEGRIRIIKGFREPGKIIEVNIPGE